MIILSPTNQGKVKILDANGYLQRSYVTGLAASGSSAFTVQSGKDTYIDQGNPNTNYGTNAYLYVYNDATNGLKRRPILELPVVWGTDVPTGATINTATFSLWYGAIYNNDPVGRTYWAYRLTKTDWVEADATWVYYKGVPLSAWVTQGGDYTTTDGASLVMPAGYGWVSWNVLALAQYAQTNNVNPEFLIKDGTEGTRTDGAIFLSNNTPSGSTYYPKLIIGYTATTSTLTTHYNNIERLLKR